MQGSRFWAGDSSESEESTESSDTEEEMMDQKITNPTSRWDVSDSDESDEDEARVAKSHREKYFETLNTVIAMTRHHANSKDWIGLVEDLANLDAQISDKLKQIIQAEGLPKKYIQCLVIVEEAVTNLSKAEQKQYSKIISKAYVKVKQNLKKILQDDKTSKLVDEFKKNPEAFEEKEEEKEEDNDKGNEKDEDEDDDDALPSKENEDEEWVSNTSISSSSDEEDDVVYTSKRDKWTLKPKDLEKLRQEKENEELKKKQMAEKIKLKEKRKEEKISSNYEYGMKEITIASLEQLVEIYCKTMENRGKKVNKVEQIMILTQLYNEAQKYEDYYKIMTGLGLITTEFHKDPDSHLSIHLWRRAIRILSTLLDLLLQNEKYELLLTYEFNSQIPEDLNKIPVPLMPLLILDRLTSDYNKSLKNIDSNSNDYLIRLPDELPLIETLYKGVDYYKKLNKPDITSQLSLLIVELRYYKHNKLADEQNKDYTLYQIFGDKLQYHPASNSTTVIPNNFDIQITNPGSWGKQPNNVNIKTHDWEKELEDLVTYINQNGSEIYKQRCILCLIYYYSIHDKFVKARDLLLLTQLQSIIPTITPSTPDEYSLLVLYNRAITQLGLAAFRMGDHINCMNCLIGLLFPKGYKQKAKELLAQGINYKVINGEKSADEIKQEKRRLLPSIQHINLDLIEVCYFISCMIVIVPSLAISNHNIVGINDHYRCFTNHLMNYEKRLFLGPAETGKDNVMYATVSLRDGDWIEANNAVQSLEIWNQFKYNELSKFKCNLEHWIKDTALQTYVLNCSGYYDSLSLERLKELFCLNSNTIHSIISKMMVDGMLLASWDQTTNTVLFHRKEPSKLQSLSYSLTYNLNYLVSANEILYESRFGNSLFEQSRFYRKTLSNRENRNNRNNMNSAMSMNRNRNNRYNNDKNKKYNNSNNPIQNTTSNRWSETTYY